MSQLIIEAAVIIVAGFFVGYYTRKLIIANKAKSLETKIANSLNETKAKQKEMIMEAKDKAFKLIEDAKHDEHGRRQ